MLARSVGRRAAHRGFRVEIRYGDSFISAVKREEAGGILDTPAARSERGGRWRRRADTADTIEVENTTNAPSRNKVRPHRDARWWTQRGETPSSPSVGARSFRGGRRGIILIRKYGDLHIFLRKKGEICRHCLEADPSVGFFSDWSDRMQESRDVKTATPDVL